MEPLSDASPRDFRSRRLPRILQIEMVELLHGTSSGNWQAIQESGRLGRPCPAKETAHVVAESFGLDPDALFQHGSYAFSRDREGDPNLYLTCDPRVAQLHAEICSEILEDALMAAFRLLHPRTNLYQSPGKEKLELFRARYRKEHGLEPVILKVRIPLADLPIPESLRVQDPHEWWRLNNEHGPLNTLTLDEPISTTQVGVLCPT
jgi:hypothetical protein